MISVVIAAHNEGDVIGRCLDSLLAGARPDEFEVIVVANGCLDRTAAIASERSAVRVIEVAEGNKSLALNVGDAAARGFPRIYLDADIIVTPRHLRVIGSALESGQGGRDVLAAVPARKLEVSGRPILVRAYYAVSSRLPTYRDGLFGRGMIGLSERGRDRFKTFPNMIADDLFLDSLFGPEERCCLDTIATTVATPRRTRDLVRRLARVRRGNNGMRNASSRGEVATAVRPADRTSWFVDVVRTQPRLYPAAIAYVGITLFAELLSRRTPRRSDGWGQDRSARQM